MRVVVCDDDPIIRCAVAAVVDHLDGQVLAETDRAFDAVDLIDRFSPDVVVLDLGLAHGSGTEVLDHVSRSSSAPAIVVFTAFDGVVGIEDQCAAVVHKPDFAELERQLAAADAAQDVGGGGERRRKVRAVTPAAGSVDDTHDFYRMLADAVAGDALVAVSAPEGDILGVAAAVRRCVRSADRVLLRGDTVLALLIGGGDEGPGALAARLATQGGGVVCDTRGVVIEDDPVGAFDSLTKLGSASQV